MAPIKPVLLAYLMSAHFVGVKFGQKRFLTLAKDRVAGTDLEKDVIARKKKENNYPIGGRGAMLGEKYYRGFMERHFDKLALSKRRLLCMIGRPGTTSCVYKDAYQ